MKATNKVIIQSYLVTSARYDFSVYEKRIIYRLVEICQAALEGQKLKGYIMNDLLFDELKEVIMPISAFLKDEKDENYVLAKKALLDLNNKVIEYEDSEIWKPIRIIEMPKLIKKGYVRFVLHKEIYEALLNFSKGFRKYELKTAMGFESVYAMRFYELLSGKEGESISYSIENLKIMFKIENKYKLTSDVIRWVVMPAQKELNEKAPLGFKYSLIYDNSKGRGRKKVKGLKFHVFRNNKNVDEWLESKELKKQTALTWDLDKMVINYLKENYLFDTDEIKHNRDLFIEASKKLDIMKVLSDKRRIANDKTNPKGYIINTLRKMLSEKS